MVALLAGVALLSLGAARTAAAETLDLSAIFTTDCSADGADLAFLDDQAATPPASGSTATSTPAMPPAGGGKACKTNMQCGKGMWCAKEVGACKSEGTCKKKLVCDKGPADPVCGCNHRTYSSECVANAHGVNVDHKGKCEKKGKHKM